MLAYKRSVAMYRKHLSAPRSVLRMAVDPISNAVAISAANPAYAPPRAGITLRSPDSWGTALAEGKLAHHLLLPILHELTHHASMNTAVGVSMAALAVSHTSVVGAAFVEHSTVPSDAMRHALMERLLRPVLEGLAMFVEFDAVSGDVPCSSASQQAAALLFCKDEMREAMLNGEDILAPLMRTLQEVRRDKSTIEKKSQLLGRTIADNDGYLLGYLLVKTIWKELVTQSSAWLHTDLFSAFLNDYFFNDFALAQLLVPTNATEFEEEADKLACYLHNRVVLLCRNAGSYMQEFLPWFHDTRAPRPAYQSYSSSAEMQLQVFWTMRTLRSLHWDTPDFTRTRHIRRVLVAPATVRVTKLGTFEAIFVDGSPPMHGPALPAGTPLDVVEAAGDGSVEAVLVPAGAGSSSGQLILCILLDKDLIATFNPQNGTFNEPDAASACDRLASYLAIESFCEKVESERMFPEGHEAQRVIDALRREDGQRRATELWAPIALMPEVGEPIRSEAAALFHPAGLAGALSLSPSQLSLLSRVSLLPTYERDRPWAVIGAHDIKQIKAINAQSMAVLGIRLLHLEGQRLQPSRI